MIALIPALLWLVAVFWAVLIIGITIQTGHVFTRRSKRPPVKPVAWTMVFMHVASFVMAILPFPVYALVADFMDARVKSFYEAQTLPAAILVIVLVLGEVAVMYLQARNAMESQMDDRLNNAKP